MKILKVNVLELEDGEASCFKVVLPANVQYYGYKHLRFI